MRQGVNIPAKKLTLEVRKVLFGEQSTELGVPKRVSLVRAQLEHGDSVGRGERVALDLALQAREGAWVSVWIFYLFKQDSPLKASLANAVATLLPIDPREATLALVQVSYGAPVLLDPGASMTISRL